MHVNLDIARLDQKVEHLLTVPVILLLADIEVLVLLLNLLFPDPFFKEKICIIAAMKQVIVLKLVDGRLKFNLFRVAIACILPLDLEFVVSGAAQARARQLMTLAVRNLVEPLRALGADPFLFGCFFGHLLLKISKRGSKSMN